MQHFPIHGSSCILYSYRNVALPYPWFKLYIVQLQNCSTSLSMVQALYCIATELQHFPIHGSSCKLYSYRIVVLPYPRFKLYIVKLQNCSTSLSKVQAVYCIAIELQYLPIQGSSCILYSYRIVALPYPWFKLYIVQLQKCSTSLSKVKAVYCIAIELQYFPIQGSSCILYSYRIVVLSYPWFKLYIVQLQNCSTSLSMVQAVNCIATELQYFPIHGSSCILYSYRIVVLPIHGSSFILYRYRIVALPYPWFKL